MAKKIDVDKYVAGLFGRTEQYAENVRKYYAYAVDELLKISANQSLEMGDLFAFKDNKRINEKATIILRQLYSAVYGEIKRGVSAEWEYANLSADALIQSIFGKGIIKDNHFAHWFGRNQKAMDAFFARTQVNGGLNLSQKVWKYTGNLREEMELALSLSLGEGGSASSISRRVRQYLQEPDKLFRRIKIGVDANGEPLYKLSKKASEYHPGQGVYRSSYKNAMRLTRTETNMAYRSADYERWQQLPFVVGVEIKLSNNHNCVGIPKGRFVDICDDLDGVYPKDFKFTGWHPQCRCVSIPKLASVDEMLEYQEKVLNDEDVSNYHFKGEVRDMPKNFSDWWEDNQESIKNATSVPYWLRDNKKLIEHKKRVKTEEEKKAIREKWKQRAKEHEIAINTANNVLKVAKEYGEVDVISLEKHLASKNIVELKKETKNVAKKVSTIKQQETALFDLIPNAHQLHQTYSMSALQEAYKELDGVMRKWLNKYKYSSIDSAPLEHLINKLKFELSSPSIRYSQKDIVSKALTEHIEIINKKIQWNNLVSKANSLKAFKTKSSTYKTALSKLDEAIEKKDLNLLQNIIANVELQQQKLINQQIKRGVKGSSALNKEYKGSVVGRDLTSQINVADMVSEDPYRGTFTNNIARMQGFDAPAKLVSEAEFDLLSKSCGDVFYRTVNPTTFKGKHMTSEEFASQLYMADLLELNGPGGRVYGDGMYVVTSAWNGYKKVPLSDKGKSNACRESLCYGRGRHTLSEMTWTRKPKIILQSDLKKKWWALTKEQRLKYGGDSDDFANTYACALGYDAMYCDGPNYMVIWNRSIIAVKKK